MMVREVESGLTSSVLAHTLTTKNKKINWRW